jgi:hypothetical protein
MARRVHDYRSKMLQHLRARRFAELAAVRNRYKQFRYATGILHSDKLFFLLASTAFYVLDLLCLRFMLRTVESYAILFTLCNLVIYQISRWWNALVY